MTGSKQENVSGPCLSLCMIVRNESFFLRDCLQQAADFVDEIIVVDTGSTDDTRAIAAKFTDKLFSFEWQDNFAEARNYALQQASGEWIVVLDADEVIEPEHWRALREILAGADKQAFFLQQRNYSYEPAVDNWTPIAEKTRYTRDYRGYKVNPIARLFRNTPDIRYRGRVHEVIDQSLEEGSYVVLDIPIHHHMDEDPGKPQRDRQLNYLRLIEQGIEDDTDGRLFTAAGSIRMHYLKDYPGAIRHLQKAVELGWKRNENLESIAVALYCMDELDAAHEAFLALYESGFRSVNLCNNLANLAVKREQFSFAADLLEEAVAIGVVDPQVRMRFDHNIRYLRDKAETS